MFGKIGLGGKFCVESDKHKRFGRATLYRVLFGKKEPKNGVFKDFLACPPSQFRLSVSRHSEIGLQKFSELR